MSSNTDDLRITGTHQLRSPEDLINLVPVSQSASQTVIQCRNQVKDILTGDDDRLVVVVGPCSIHDPDAALEYADKLVLLRAKGIVKWLPGCHALSVLRTARLVVCRLR